MTSVSKLIEMSNQDKQKNTAKYKEMIRRHEEETKAIRSKMVTTKSSKCCDTACLPDND